MQPAVLDREKQKHQSTRRVCLLPQTCSALLSPTLVHNRATSIAPTFPIHTPTKAKGHISSSPQLKKSALSSNREDSNEEANFFHKKGNTIDGKEDDVAEVQDFSGEETRDLHLDEGVGNSELGFPIHTPTKPKGLISSSPQLKKNALSNNWKIRALQMRNFVTQPHN